MIVVACGGAIVGAVVRLVVVERWYAAGAGVQSRGGKLSSAVLS
jgi:hypothetical protein